MFVSYLLKNIYYDIQTPDNERKTTSEKVIKSPLKGIKYRQSCRIKGEMPMKIKLLK